MHKLFFIITILVTVVAACSNSKVVVQNQNSIKGKKIAIVQFKFSMMQSGGSKKDTLCICGAQSAQQAIIPFLQQAGFTVVDVTIDPAWSATKILQVTDSLQIDYLLTANGLVQFTGNSAFMHELNMKIVDISKQQVYLSGTLNGSGITIAQAINKMGEKMVKQVH